MNQAKAKALGCIDCGSTSCEGECFDPSPVFDQANGARKSSKERRQTRPKTPRFEGGGSRPRAPRFE